MMLVPFLNVVAKDEWEELNNATTESCKTGRDAEGPFYKPDAPMRKLLKQKVSPYI